MRVPMYKIPLPVHKGRPTFDIHKVQRDDLLTEPSLKYPMYKRLPEFWRKEFETPKPLINQHFKLGTKRPQTRGLWIKGIRGLPVEVRDLPIRVDYTDEVNEGLWGGEGLVTGYKYGAGDKMNPKHWRVWKPILHRKTFYSEVLERVIETTVTPRTLRLMDEACGFDHYILKTPVNELCSRFGNELKREMLHRLLDRDSEMYRDDPEKRETIYRKYKKYEMSRDRVEWVGLSLKEAMLKQWEKEKEEGLHDSVPLLKIYTEQLKERLTDSSTQKESEEQGNLADQVTVFQPSARSES